MSADLESSVKAFADAAWRYCALVEFASEHSPDHLRRELTLCLPDLYLAGLRLSVVEPDHGKPTDIVVARPTLGELRAGLHKSLGIDDYLEIFNPMGAQRALSKPRAGNTPDRDESVPMRGSLCDDLICIYQHVKVGLLMLDEGESAAEVLWEWKNAFDVAWGRRTADAIRVLHYAVHD